MREADFEEIDKEGRRHVDKDMFEVEERSEEEGCFHVAPLKDARDGEEEEAKEKSIVLKMNVIDEKEAEIGEEAKDDDHLIALDGGNAIGNGGRGVAAKTGQQLRKSRLKGLP